ncbi:hypothetical protein JCM8097_005008 [Rhodosporidiobolus ruineniae]
MSSPLSSPAAPASPPPSSSAADIPTHESLLPSDTLVKREFVTVARGPERKAPGHRIYYELHGQDGLDASHTRVVLIMGLSNSLAAWHNQFPFLPSQPGYSVLVLDNRGVGYSGAPAHALSASLTRYRTSEMARDVVEVLEYLGWVKEGEEERRLNVVGISMGGMIAQELALLLPTQTRTLLLTSTRTGSRRFPPDLPSLKATKMFLKQTAGLAKTPEAQMGLIVDVLYPTGYLEEEVEADGSRRRKRREVLEEEFLYRYKKGRRQPLAGRVGQTAAVLAHHLSPARLALLAASIPRIAIIHGEEDELIHVERAREMHRDLPGSSLRLIPSAGHALPSQIRDEYNEWLRKNIDRPVRGESGYVEEGGAA